MMAIKIVVLCLSVHLVLIQCALLGGWSPVDLKDEKVSNIMSFVETSINAQSNSMFLDKMTKVTRAAKQLVNGVNYQIEFVMERTKCAKNSGSKDLTGCQLSGTLKQLCKAKVYESFSNKKSLNDFKCLPQRVNKRAGGIKTVSDPTIYTDTLTRVLSMQNAALTNIKILSARTQVVAGQNIMLTISANTLDGKTTICNTQIWSRPWLSSDEGFKVTKFECDKKFQYKRVNKRAGGITAVSNPSIYKDTVTRVLSMQNAALKNVKILSAKTQVVAGQRIILKISAENIDGEITVCDADIWVRVWIKSDDGFKVTNFQCDKNFIARKGRRALLGGVTGGISAALPNKEQYLTTAKMALSMTNSLLTDLEVLNVRTQVVAGQKIYMKVAGKENGARKVCDITVWSRPWLGAPGFQVTDFKCQKPSSEKRDLIVGGRPCAGCVSSKNTNANTAENLLLISKAVGLSQPNLVAEKYRIVSVRTQVVAGIKYIMEVEITQNGKPKMCDVVFVEQPWMKKDMTVLKFDCNQKLE